MILKKHGDASYEKDIDYGCRRIFASRFINFYKDKYDIIPLRRQDLDITDRQKVIEAFELYKPDYVLHTAAMAATKDCEDNPQKAYDINVNGSIYAAEACRKINAKLVYFSSEQIFNGNIENGPYDEEIVPQPNTAYGRNKLEAEKKVRDIIDNVWILRFTWLFGFPERNSKVNANIIVNVLKAALKNEKTKFPANEYRGMTYVYDLISNFEKIFEIPYGTYNTGSENNLSTYETACIVLRELGLDSRKDEIIEKDTEKYKESTRDLRISNKKLRNSGISFMTTEEGIKKCIQEFHYNFVNK